MVRSYSRRRHGRASFGGGVSGYNRDFKKLAGVVERTQGSYEKKPVLIVKPWKFATNHIEETGSGDTTKASVILDKSLLKERKLADFLMLHELRENQLLQDGLFEPEAHAIASSYGDKDARMVGLKNYGASLRKVYKQSPRIFTDKELSKLSKKKMFSKE